MRNSKNLKTTLSAISIIAIFVAMIMSIIASTAQTYDSFNYLYTIYNNNDWTTWQVCLDWDYAGLFLAFLVIGFITTIVKCAMFTIPAVRSRSNHACTTLLCDVLAIAGLALIIICMFLPEGVEMAMVDGITDATTNAGYKKLVAASIAGWVGAPLAFIASLGTIGLSRVATKK